MSILISNIQRFCLHDGPGIRTTVFLMGCSIRCPWCANPENLLNKEQYFIEIEKCKKEWDFGIKRECCKYNQQCSVVHCADYRLTLNELEMKNCPFLAIGKYGNYYNVESLEMELKKDIIFFTSGGGITFSGGEALLQIEELEPLLVNLKRSNINLCIETALFVKPEMLEIALKYIDLFIIDVKILDPIACKNILGGDISIFIKNIETLFFYKKEIIIRYPVVDPYTVNNKNISMFIKFLESYRPKKTEIFKIHNLAKKKYITLGTKFNEFGIVEDSFLFTLKEKIENLNIICDICKI